MHVCNQSRVFTQQFGDIVTNAQLRTCKTFKQHVKASYKGSYGFSQEKNKCTC